MVFCGVMQKECSSEIEKKTSQPFMQISAGNCVKRVTRSQLPQRDRASSFVSPKILAWTGEMEIFLI